LREHGGETYSGQPEHRRSTLTPHTARPFNTSGGAAHCRSQGPDAH
jgi:hypothetical protein